MKGPFDGECNRTTCKASGVRHYNFRTHAYYCATCARKIDIAEVIDPSQPQCFDYPQRPDTADRHLHVKREKPFADHHPDKKSLNERCPTCAAPVHSVFDHVAIDCEHD